MNQKLLISILLMFSATFVLGQGVWNQKRDFYATKHLTASFSIGSKGYIVSGVPSGNGYSKDLREYDPSKDKWTKKADLPGDARYGAVGFAINGKGYLFGGYSGLGQFENDLYEYDPSTNKWIQKSSCPGNPRSLAVAFTIGNKAYIGLGSFTTIEWNDFWEYDTSTDKWKQIADFKGSARRGAIAFTIGNKGYVGTGDSFKGTIYDDFWQYDPIKDKWTRKADFKGGLRKFAVGFSLGDKGYLCTGHKPGEGNMKDFWEYNDLTDSWTQLSDFEGEPRHEAFSFVINNSVYIGLGISNPPIPDVWKYTSTVGVDDIELKDEINLYPNPTENILHIEYKPKKNNKYELTIFNSYGQIVREKEGLSNGSIQIERKNLSSGIYYLRLITSDEIREIKKFLIQ